MKIVWNKLRERIKRWGEEPAMFCIRVDSNEKQRFGLPHYEGIPAGVVEMIGPGLSEKKSTIGRIIKLLKGGRQLTVTLEIEYTNISRTEYLTFRCVGILLFQIPLKSVEGLFDSNSFDFLSRALNVFE